MMFTWDKVLLPRIDAMNPKGGSHHMKRAIQAPKPVQKLAGADLLLAQRELASLIELRDAVNRKIETLEKQVEASAPAGSGHYVTTTLSPMTEGQGLGTPTQVAPRRTLTEAARNRIAAAQKKRWEAHKKLEAKAKKETATAKRPAVKRASMTAGGSSMAFRAAAGPDISLDDITSDK
jgi:ribosomal protein S12 methylthiotransferase accessory factor YcaO